MMPRRTNQTCHPQAAELIGFAHQSHELQLFSVCQAPDYRDSRLVPGDGSLCPRSYKVPTPDHQVYFHVGISNISYVDGALQRLRRGADKFENPRVGAIIRDPSINSKQPILHLFVGYGVKHYTTQAKSLALAEVFGEPLGEPVERGVGIGNEPGSGLYDPLGSTFKDDPFLKGHDTIVGQDDPVGGSYEHPAADTPVHGENGIDIVVDGSRDGRCLGLMAGGCVGEGEGGDKGEGEDHGEQAGEHGKGQDEQVPPSNKFGRHHNHAEPPPRPFADLKAPDVASPLSVGAVKPLTGEAIARYGAKTKELISEHQIAQKKYGNREITVVGAGPTGLYTAIDLYRKGFDVNLVEKRTSYSRINTVVTVSFDFALVPRKGAPSPVSETLSGSLNAVESINILEQSMASQVESIMSQPDSGFKTYYGYEVSDVAGLDGHGARLKLSKGKDEARGGGEGRESFAIDTKNIIIADGKASNLSGMIEKDPKFQTEIARRAAINGIKEGDVATLKTDLKAGDPKRFAADYYIQTFFETPPEWKGTSDSIYGAKNFVIKSADFSYIATRVSPKDFEKFQRVQKTGTEAEKVDLARTLMQRSLMIDSELDGLPTPLSEDSIKKMDLLYKSRPDLAQFPMNNLTLDISTRQPGFYSADTGVFVATIGDARLSPHFAAGSGIGTGINGAIRLGEFLEAAQLDNQNVDNFVDAETKKQQNDIIGKYRNQFPKKDPVTGESTVPSIGQDTDPSTANPSVISYESSIRGILDRSR